MRRLSFPGLSHTSLSPKTRIVHEGAADGAASVRVKPARVIKRLVSCPSNEVDHMFINLDARRLAQSDLTLLQHHESGPNGLANFINPLTLLYRD
jgi:hypothetical protein